MTALPLCAACGKQYTGGPNGTEILLKPCQCETNELVYLIPAASLAVTSVMTEPTNPDPDAIIWTDANGVEQCLEDECLAELLKGSVLFVLPITYLDYRGEKKETTGLFVNCSDLFAWGGADIEELPFDQIAALYKAWKADPRFGSSKWCCQRRNQRPQAPAERDMREAGTWDDAMEALPLNTRDAEVHAIVAAAVAAQRPKPAEPEAAQ